jgi:hypothetical protein
VGILSVLSPTYATKVLKVGNTAEQSFIFENNLPLEQPLSERSTLPATHSLSPFPMTLVRVSILSLSLAFAGLSVASCQKDDPQPTTPLLRRSNS